MYVDKYWWLMLILNYLIYKKKYVVPNFSYGMSCYFTISKSSWYVYMIGFMEKNKDGDDDSVLQSWVSNEECK